jgi:hypothetical protein
MAPLTPPLSPIVRPSEKRSSYLWNVKFTNSCSGKFGAPTQPAEPNTLKINAESNKVPSPLSSPLKFWIDLDANGLEGTRFFQIKSAVEIAGLILGLFTFVRGYQEYRRQNDIKKMEVLLNTPNK